MKPVYALALVLVVSNASAQTLRAAPPAVAASLSPSAEIAALRQEIAQLKGAQAAQASELAKARTCGKLLQAKVNLILGNATQGDESSLKLANVIDTSICVP